MGCHRQTGPHGTPHGRRPRIGRRR